MITVWGRADSSATARVMWTLGEAGLTHHRRDWGGEFGGNDDPAFRALSPPGKIPALTTDDGFSLWESGAIIAWLATETPQAGLWPDGDGRWQAQAWMDWSPAAGRVVGAVRTAYRRERPDSKEMAEAVVAAGGVLSLVERQLEGRDYILGQRLSVADLALGVIVHRWFRVPETVARPDLPALEAWHQRLCARPAYQDHVVAKVSVRPQTVGMGA